MPEVHTCKHFQIKWIARQAVSPVFSKPAGPWGQGPLYFYLGYFCSPSDSLMLLTFLRCGLLLSWPPWCLLSPLGWKWTDLHLSLVILVEACTCVFSQPQICTFLKPFHPWKTKHVYFSPFSCILIQVELNGLFHQKKSLGISYLWADPGEVKGLFLFYLNSIFFELKHKYH